MIKKASTLLSVLCFCLTLTSCGFHLRNTHDAKLPFKILQLEPYAPEERFQQRLILRLQRDDIVVNDEHAPSDWLLRIEPITTHSTPIAFGPTGEMVREKIRMSLPYTLVHLKNRIKEETIWTERQHQIDYSAQLATDYDRATVLNEMQNDLITQLLMQLSVTAS
jgi:outer membrane lipopolysaccharide assembly protein LptE/RlpB